MSMNLSMKVIVNVDMAAVTVSVIIVRESGDYGCQCGCSERKCG